VRELPADLETPVSVYLKLAGQGPSFLLESVTGGEHLARYSFIGVHPSRAYVLRGRSWKCRAGTEVRAIPVATGADPLDSLRAELDAFRAPPVPGLPRFAGGLVGYLSYEMIRYFEPSVPVKPHPACQTASSC
jgi:anthranilate synthase component I